MDSAPKNLKQVTYELSMGPNSSTQPNPQPNRTPKTRISLLLQEIQLSAHYVTYT